MRMAGRAAWLAVLITAALVSASCVAPAQAPTPAAGQLPNVLATTTFLADIAQNVAGTRLVVESLLPVTADPHEYQPTPKDAFTIAQSQVLIINGLGYETWLTNLLGAGGIQPQTITASDGLQPRAGSDPHMWMNPLDVIRYAENIRNGLSKVDPAGASDYTANAAAYVGRLSDLDAWIKTQIDQVPPEKRLLVTNHDELGYFADAYGFKILGAVIPSVTSGAAPSAQQMAQLIQTVKSSGAPAIFLDVNENQNLARQIASETGAKVVTNLYVESLSAKDGPAPTYIAMMKYDVTAIVEALK
jgi:zinc/manganese transport system substrate-binding protein